MRSSDMTRALDEIGEVALLQGHVQVGRDGLPVGFFTHTLTVSERIQSVNKAMARNPTIDVALVKRLIASQFPLWARLPVSPVAVDGWDHRSFRLGDMMIARLPGAAAYAVQVEKEHRWLPKLAPSLPLAIPQPLALGEPDEDYPWRWSIYRWIHGQVAARAQISDASQFATTLARFLRALQRANTHDGPLPGPENFFRGGSLTVYAQQARQAIETLRHQINAASAMGILEAAVPTTWQSAPVWVHGDMSAGNLLVRDGELTAVIDFGLLAIGDPACDLAIGWTFLDRRSRSIFRSEMQVDPDTWTRARAWALWKAAIVAAGVTATNEIETAQCWRTLAEVVSDPE